MCNCAYLSYFHICAQQLCHACQCAACKFALINQLWQQHDVLLHCCCCAAAGAPRAVATTWVALPMSSPSPRCRQPCTTSQARPNCMTAATHATHQAGSTTWEEQTTRSSAPHGDVKQRNSCYCPAFPAIGLESCTFALNVHVTAFLQGCHKSTTLPVGFSVVQTAPSMNSANLICTTCRTQI
jgi:hypothetical protein